MMIIASPIYYHGISGQLKCVIDRFYSALYPTAPKTLDKIAMFLSSGDRNQYDGAIFFYKCDFVGDLGLRDMGMFSTAGSITKEQLAAIRMCGKSLQ